MSQKWIKMDVSRTEILLVAEMDKNGWREYMSICHAFLFFSTYSINDNMLSNSSTVILLYSNAICLVWTSCFSISYALLFISMYFICLPYHVIFFTLKCYSSGLLQCHVSLPIIHAYVALVFFCNVFR